MSETTMPALSGLFIFLFLMAGTQGLILSFVLWRHKSNRIQNRILAWMVLLFSLNFYFFIITNIPHYYFHPLYPGIITSWTFVTGGVALLPMYQRSCFGLNPWPRHAWLYWVLPAFFAMHTIAFYILGKTIVKDLLVPGWICVAYLVGVTAFSYYKFRNCSIKSTDMLNSQKTKAYLRYMLLFFTGYAATHVLGFILFTHIPMQWSLYISICFKLVTAVAIYAIAYLNVQNAHQTAPIVMAYPEPIEKYKFSSLDGDTANYIQHRLQKLVETEKIYLQRDLRLKDVADKLGASVHHVSQVLNERLQLSFSDFVNKLRVEEAMRMLATGDDSKIESLALDSGFNNKVSFNKAFKKFTGVTPSQYKAGLQEGEQGIV